MWAFFGIHHWLFLNEHYRRLPWTSSSINCAELFMMASKARLFGYDTALSAILASDNPREQNHHGRQVHHFDPAFCQGQCEGMVVRGTFAKFYQNEEIVVALESTGTRRTAEASPQDKVWGIGLTASDLRAASPASRCGLNLLGRPWNAPENRWRN